MNLGPGIYGGECLVKNRAGYASMFIINTTAENVNLTVPPVTLEAFYSTMTPVRTVRGTNKEEKRAAIDRRVREIIKHLRLDGLTKKEKQSVIDLVTRYPNQFHLPGDKLGETEVMTDKIPTTDEIPMNVKQYRHPHH